MKVLCSACEAAEARVLCCADDAALCTRCDRNVHAANRLAGKHHRLPLLSSASNSNSPSSSSATAASSSPPPPKCDICQECHAYFFCVEDRALLCRSCDVAVHTANAFVSAHRRFLLTGVQVGLDLHDDDENHPQHPDPPKPPLQQQQQPPPPAPGPAAASTRKRSPTPLYNDDDDVIDFTITGNLPDWSLVNDQFTSPAPPPPPPVVVATTKAAGQPKRSSAAAVFAGLAGGSPDWPLDEFFGFADFNAGGFGGGFTTENGTSKADSGKIGSMDGSPNGRSSSTTSSAAAGDFFGQVPEVHWAVPELPSPPTASGLHWQGGPRYGVADAGGAVFVPDISSPENPFRCFAGGGGQNMKRRRRG
uniref:B box-type domain-containing protein n=1 Tax=Leersia perrieri TaxID=77586 RepID=A0A0D9UY09_9ORYZ